MKQCVEFDFVGVVGVCCAARICSHKKIDDIPDSLGDLKSLIKVSRAGCQGRACALSDKQNQVEFGWQQVEILAQHHWQLEIVGAIEFVFEQIDRIASRNHESRISR
jgi:hypothetical protein